MEYDEPQENHENYDDDYGYSDGHVNIKFLPFWDRGLEKYEKTINLIISDKDDYYSSCSPQYIIATEKLFPKKLFKCKISKKCKYETNRVSNLTRHQRVCAKNSVQTEQSKQMVYGEQESVMTDLINYGFVGAEHGQFRQKYWATFDIECLETPINSDDETGRKLVKDIIF